MYALPLLRALWLVGGGPLALLLLPPRRLALPSPRSMAPKKQKVSIDDLGIPKSVGTFDARLPFRSTRLLSLVRPLPRLTTSLASTRAVQRLAKSAVGLTTDSLRFHRDTCSPITHARRVLAPLPHHSPCPQLPEDAKLESAITPALVRSSTVFINYLAALYVRPSPFTRSFPTRVELS